MQSYYFLSREARSTCRSYACVGKRIMKRKELSALVEKPAAGKDSHARFSVKHLEDFRLAVQSSKVVLMLVRAAQHYTNSPNKVPALNSAFLSMAGLSLLLRLWEMYDSLHRRR